MVFQNKYTLIADKVDIKLEEDKVARQRSIISTVAHK
tara:strand:+ start:119 stop:229 length:111 start_codon:yes stop_codon:yes gene_type:complete